MKESKTKAPAAPLSWWHSLLYSTGVLLLVCGIPGAAAIPFALMADGSAGLNRQEAILFSLCMIGAVVLIAGIMLLIAEWLTRRQLNRQC